MGNYLIGIIIGFIIGAIVGIGAEYSAGAGKAIAQCESQLPRNQSCEAVITARVKE